MPWEAVTGLFHYRALWTQ